MKQGIVTGPKGQLGPIWCETLKEMEYEVFGIGLPDYDISKPEHIRGAKINFGSKVADVIILNAAIDNPPQSESTFHGNLEEILTVNLIGACNVVKAFLPDMIEAKKGTIIGITSIQGRQGADWRNYPEKFEKPVSYNISKAGLEQYVRSLATQYGRYGIRACCIGFGAYDGGKLEPEFLKKYLKNVPLGRPVSTESVKAALRFAIECPEFAGQTVMIDGGYCAW